ncbi:hypothetical protein K1X76_02740 [bacterium]|nr:hypothetical protein [bacterium]
MNGTFIIILLVILLAPIQNAHAYLDPGTGSMIVQVVVGGFLAALYTVKAYWHKIKKFFKRSKDIQE